MPIDTAETRVTNIINIWEDLKEWKNNSLATFILPRALFNAYVVEVNCGSETRPPADPAAYGYLHLRLAIESRLSSLHAGTDN